MNHVRNGLICAIVVFIVFFIFLRNQAQADPYTFTCYRYVDGKPTGGWINMKADSKEEAEAKAYARFKELGGQVDYAKCKY